MEITYNHVKSAIIGYWRSGAELIQIMLLMGMPYSDVEKIIENYKKKINAI